jgi:hypothetical protein
MKGAIKMNVQKLSQHVMSAILIMFLLVGCGVPAATPTPTSEPSPELVVEVGDVTFDGTECTVSGSTELPPGRYSFVLKNLSEEDASLLIFRLPDGKAFQDLLDLQSEPGEWVSKPDWAIDAVETGVAWYKEDGGEVHTYMFINEGEYALVIWRMPAEATQPGIWFCAPFWVKEDASE